MATEIVRIKEVDPVESGNRQDGTSWVQLNFRGETLDRYPRTINFSLDGENLISKNPVNVGLLVEVSFEVSSRSFTDREGKTRWANSIRAYRVAALNASAEASVQQQQQYQQEQAYAPAYPQQQPQPQYPQFPQYPQQR